ncbi:Membrane proteinase PrsW, cleaves anti-sigma factor RsiW, M82 family [Raineyella antarctica]|uniref:Membrane proteinase PrsW, cleaves anti-sigma factor RsiW, M82 family n=1 Tax=Raineyella antarctica TaxID=1577474 RepID=A0A1G6H3P5_9ACTN|nr:PrsW family intramembrane metalloprotease [Raineyella antarctica]SDB88535.1 Membrane proteinase PrsW, cleaves anti-sigma factor RsiW, M82 family [Raineyella antarctica]
MLSDPLTPAVADPSGTGPDREVVRARRRNGLSVPVDPSMPLPRRVLRDWRTWVSLGLVVLFVGAFLANWILFVPEHTMPSGTIQGLGTDVLPGAARLAAFTGVPLTILFILADRVRPQSLWLWLVALVWGGLVATGISAPLNTWAAAHLSVIGNGDPATSMRGAVFIAPFVEEAAKATVLFGIAILMRNRVTTWLSSISLAGLAGTGFAFVENIIYYGRVFRYVSSTTGTGDAQQAMNQLALMRGGMTFFAHPLFTMMTGIGLAVALRARSKRVRVLAPLTGFLVAALLHMVFNFTASSGGQVGLMLWFVALSVVAAMVGLAINQVRRERALVHARVTDFARLGWLHPDDADAFSRARIRSRALWEAFWAGPSTYLATVRIQHSATELAYLRDAIHRGLVDATGEAREAEVLRRIEQLRAVAVVVPQGAVEYPWQRWRRTLRQRREEGLPAWGGLLRGPTPHGPLGSSSTEYSPVDPRWGPPKQ